MKLKFLFEGLYEEVLLRSLGAIYNYEKTYTDFSDCYLYRDVLVIDYSSFSN